MLRHTLSYFHHESSNKMRDNNETTNVCCLCLPKDEVKVLKSLKMEADCSYETFISAYLTVDAKTWRTQTGSNFSCIVLSRDCHWRLLDGCFFISDDCI